MTALLTMYPSEYPSILTMIMTKLQHTKTLVELAEDILAAAKALEQHLPSSPTFQHDTIGELATEQQHFRKALIDASSEINALARGAGGPLGRIFDMSYSVSRDAFFLLIFQYRRACSELTKFCSALINLFFMLSATFTFRKPSLWMAKSLLQKWQASATTLLRIS